MTKTLGIIGTAGRSTDGPRLTASSFSQIVEVAKATFHHQGCTALVSGGAAWADHAVIQMFLDGAVEASAITLHFPAGWTPRGFDSADECGRTANYYHALFSQKTGRDSLREIDNALLAGARALTNHRGFLARNRDVARQADALLAFTFGGPTRPWVPVRYGNVKAREAGLQDGGTAHTWDASQAGLKVHVRVA